MTVTGNRRLMEQQDERGVMDMEKDKIIEDYQKEIMEMVKRINNTEWLHFIHKIIKNLIK